MKYILKIILKVFSPQFSKYCDQIGIISTFKAFVVQKILRFNANIPWPVHWTSKISCPEKINPGSRCPGLSAGCHIDGRNGIVIEENVWIGPRVSIISMNHSPNNYREYLISKPIVIKKNCWLATNAVILPGVELGEHTIVAAGAVVTVSFLEGNQVLAGAPAKIVKKLGGYEE